MTITLGYWLLPLLVTVASGVWAFWPEPPSYGDYNFGGALVSLAKLGLGVIASLLAWLLYFIIV